MYKHSSFKFNLKRNRTGKKKKKLRGERTAEHSGPCLATSGLVLPGIPPSAAGCNINPPVGRRLAGAHGQQPARLEAGLAPGICVRVLRCPLLALVCVCTMSAKPSG